MSTPQTTRPDREGSPHHLRTAARQVCAILLAALSGCTGTASTCSADGWCGRPVPDAQWLAVVAVADNQAVAVGRRGRTALFDGARWRLTTALEGTIEAVASTGRTAVAVGNAGLGWRWRNGTWQALSGAADGYDLTHAWLGFDEDLVWAAGRSASRGQPPTLALLRHDGRGWQTLWTLPDSGDGAITGLCGTDTGERLAIGVLGAGPAALIVRPEEDRWVETVDPDRGLPATCVAHPRGLLVVDRAMQDLRWETSEGVVYLDRACDADGCAPNTTIAPAAVITTGGTVVLAGDLLLESRDGMLQDVGNPSPHALLAAAAAREGDTVLAVGRLGTIVRRAGTRWRVEDSGVTEHLVSAAVLDAYFVAAGEAGTLMHKQIPSREVE